MESIYWDNSYNSILLVNFVIVIGLFACIRFFLGAVAHVDTSEQLFKKDNPAFGLSMTGVVFAVAILLSGLIFGGPDINLISSSIKFMVFGVTGIVLMILTRIIFDKITLPDISLRKEINKGNVAVAIADTGNVLAAAIILRAVMMWITDDTLNSIMALIAAYAISQAILTLATFIRRKIFRMRKTGYSIQQELKDGNVALALAFAGRKIGTALAFVVAANIVVYEIYEIQNILLPWALVSIAIIFVLKLVSFIAEKAVLFGVDMDHEILAQKNPAAGALRAVIYISMALLLAEI